MKLFECQTCGQLLYFQNTHCEGCGLTLGYLPERTLLTALKPQGGDRWTTVAAPQSAVRFCANARHGACNWLVPADSGDAFCRACRLNRTIPDIDVADNLLLWQRVEAAKHRLVYSLLRLGLPLVSRFEDPEHGLAFDFLRSPDGMQAGPTVMTGHAFGLVTIDVGEADAVERERHRRDMVEPYRTLLGHFRHEIGHYYWDRLVRGGVWHDAFREMFGDERQDYQQALAAHYAQGPQAGWQDTHVSSYAGSHPWEDFAETWAHYLHIVDTLETAASFGISVHPVVGRRRTIDTDMDFDPHEQEEFDALIAAWLPITYAVNGLNQSMGQPDLYPFVLSPTVLGKLRFVHGLIHREGGVR